MKKYKIVNKLKQTILLDDGKYLWGGSFIIVEKITEQMKQLQEKGFINIRNL